MPYEERDGGRLWLTSDQNNGRGSHLNFDAPARGREIFEAGAGGERFMSTRKEERGLAVVVGASFMLARDEATRILNIRYIG